MKVLFVNQYYLPDHSATARLLADLAQDLAREGEDVRVITSRGGYEGGAWLPPEEVIENVRVQRVSATGLGKRRLAGRALDYLTFLGLAGTALARSEGADVIVSLTTPPMLGPVSVSLGRLRRTPVVSWVQDVYPDVAIALGFVSETGITSTLLRRAARYSHEKAAGIAVLSERMGARLRDHGAPASKITTLWNWADGNLIQPKPPEASAMRQSLGVPPEHLLVMYSGNFGLSHDLSTLVEAARELERRRAPVTFAFVGSGARRSEAERSALGATSIRFAPYQPYSSLGDSLTAADIHLVSLREGLEGLVEPSKLYGILAAGRPTLFVGPNDAEPARVIREHGVGWVTRPGDVTGIVDAVAAAASDRVRVRELGARARLEFTRCFDRPVAVRRWHAFLRDVAQRSRAPSSGRRGD
jgi:colanic acid biosynthesis glycosyl transferase WcaI